MEKLTAVRQYIDKTCTNSISFVLGKGNDNIILMRPDGNTWSFKFFQELNDIANIHFINVDKTEIRIFFRDSLTNG